jgi:hypothetical protein
MQIYLYSGFATLALMLASSAHAGQLLNLQLYDGSAAPTATISFTNSDGTDSNSESRTVTNTLIGFGVYNSEVAYRADFWQATHDPSNGLYQDLDSNDPSCGVVPFALVPEPSSGVLASVSVLFLAVLHLWRRIG